MHKNKTLDNCINYKRSKGKAQHVIKSSLALAKIESDSSSVHIYTDASKTQDNKTSAVFYIPDLNVEHGSRTTDHISIFAAEL